MLWKWTTTSSRYHLYVCTSTFCVYGGVEGIGKLIIVDLSVSLTWKMYRLKNCNNVEWVVLYKYQWYEKVKLMLDHNIFAKYA